MDDNIVQSIKQELNLIQYSLQRVNDLLASWQEQKGEPNNCGNFLPPVESDQPDSADTFDNDMIMLRRVAHHKTVDQSLETAPLLTPLNNLHSTKRNELIERIFRQATFNVKNLIMLKEDDPEFDSKVEEEADRLLNVWLTMNATTTHSCR